MPTIFDRIQRLVAAVACGGLLLFSGYAVDKSKPFDSPDPSPVDKADTRAALAILDRAPSFIRNLEPCDPLKAQLPDKFEHIVGDRRVTETTLDAIVCVKGAIDYADALQTAGARKLLWTAAVGGQRVVAFAKSEQQFRELAARDGIVFRPGELQPFSQFMAGLHSNARSRLVDHVWVIQPGPESEALFGPYAELPPGDYRVSMTFAPARPNACADLTKLQVIAAATADARRHILADRQPVAMQPQAGADCRVTGHFDFSVPSGGGHAIETPIWIASDQVLDLVGYDIEAR